MLEKQVVIVATPSLLVGGVCHVELQPGRLSSNMCGEFGKGVDVGCKLGEMIWVEVKCEVLYCNFKPKKISDCITHRPMVPSNQSNPGVPL